MCDNCRFRKGSNTNSNVPGEALQDVATIERDSRPLIFKYNEVYTVILISFNMELCSDMFFSINDELNNSFW